MDGYVDKWMDGWIDGWIDRWMMDGWICGQMGGWVDRWMRGWMDGGMDDGWTCGQMGGCLGAGLQLGHFLSPLSVSSPPPSPPLFLSAVSASDLTLPQMPTHDRR